MTNREFPRHFRIRHAQVGGMQGAPDSETGCYQFRPTAGDSPGRLPQVGRVACDSVSVEFSHRTG